MTISESKMTTLNATVHTIRMFQSPVPFWGTLIIAIATGIFMICLFVCCCYFFCCRKKRKRRKAGVFTGTWGLNTRKNLMQPDLEDLMSTYGHIYFSIDYQLAEEMLNVSVLRIKNLTKADFIDPCSPYVKVRLSPSPKYFQTRVQPLTHNPEYEESFKFKMSLKEQEKAIVIFTVYDYQLFARHKKLGQLQVPLRLFQLGELLQMDFDLEEPVKTFEDAELGDICLSVKYVPKGELRVVIIEAKNLIKTDPDLKDPFVKLTLQLESKIIKKKKKQTSTIPTTGVNPYFNETITFKIAPENIRNATLRVVVYFHTTFGRKRPVGEVILGLKEPGTGYKQWSECMQNMGTAFAQWHTLGALID